ncbi:peptidylprolyl isomerase [Sediminitomix flava]|uniref:Peptidyl-prolyl cis-trans isomerase n=1 Tax=Sediminitomix flava TaxID=379075 RepID=A0A315ZI05_SEDFL|nr:peptidylprolyl isomerase [Sediminitomix flava]PWJ44932.1 peptidylprolyl isomerase/peptidyl-prolyl cis-trans isomerase B (cyclophilin B) [Sediminitomix flava]
MKKQILFSLLLAFFFSVGNSYAQKKKKKDEIVTIHTSYGDIVVVLFDETPNHKGNFLNLAKTGFYDSTAFHRVLLDFVVQGGDPNTKPDAKDDRVGLGSEGDDIKAEIVEGILHDRGRIGAARQGDQINPEKKSSASQFYFVQAKDGAHHLDGDYTVFGEVISGMDVVDEIAEVKVDSKGLPEEPVRISMDVKKMKAKKVMKMYGYDLSKSPLNK